MKKKVVLVGLVIILLGVVMAFIGFSEVTPYVMVYSGNLPPGQSVVKELSELSRPDGRGFLLPCPALP